MAGAEIVRFRPSRDDPARPKRRTSGIAIVLAAWGGACAPLNDPLQRGFAAPPPEARPWTWWHWMNGNITADGAVRDLAWMKRAGLGGVQLFEGSLGTPQVVAKRLPWMSADWQSVLRTSIAEADRLGLDVQIASSPGWSASGAPFVAAADAMKKLVWSRTDVEGGRPIPLPLALPPAIAGPFQDVPAAEPGAPAFYRDIAVIAFPAPDAPLPTPQVADGAGRPLDGAGLADSRYAAPIGLPLAADGSALIRFDFGRPVAVGALTLGVETPHGFGAPPAPDAVLESSEDGRRFAPVATLRPNTAQVRTAGFAPLTARYFRIRFARPAGTGGLPPVAPGVALPDAPPPPATVAITEARLAARPQIDRWIEKAGFATMVDYPAAEAAPTGFPFPAPSDVVDLTGRLRVDGTLDWTPPAGRRWTVLRFGYSLTGKHNGPAPEEATGLEVDKLDSDAVRRYLDGYIDRYAQAAGPDLVGHRGITGILSDSLEAGSQNWTPDLIAAFRRMRGYDPVPFLPALTGVPIGGAAASERFLWDYRQTLGDLLARSHYAVLAQTARRRGLSYYAEALEDHRPTLGDDLAMRSYADVPMGAMWYPGGARPTLIADLQGAASVASVYGRRLVGSETFTAFGAPFAQTPGDLRATADLAFALGVNRIMIHTSPHQPLVGPGPGMTLTPLLGQSFTRNETWAEMARGWTDYLARTSWLLQQGRRAVDVAWFVGEDAPVTALYGDTPFSGLPEGYAFDFVGKDGLTRALRVDATGRLTSDGGTQYRVLALDPNCSHLSLSVVRRLAALVDAGAVLAGPRPVGTPSGADDPAAWQAAVDGLWGGATGKGRVYPTVGAAMAALAMSADWQVPSDVGRGDLAVTHRLLDDADIWFVANRRSSRIETRVSFRTSDRAPEFWDAVSGRRRAAGYRREGDRTIVPISLAAGGSTFVVFRQRTSATARDIPPRRDRVLAEWNDGWTLTLDGMQPVLLPRLASWTTLTAPQQRYFSGIGTYRRTVSLSRAWLAYRADLALDLGKVGGVAEVRINGRQAGTVWAADQRLPVGRWLRPGTNRIEVRVANTWVNRLIGDAQPSAEPVASTPPRPWRADAPLLPSGLLSPVRLISDAAGDRPIGEVPALHN